MENRDWKTVARSYRDRLSSVISGVALVAFGLLIYNPVVTQWARNIMGDWYHNDFLWWIISFAAFAGIFALAEVLQRLVFYGLEQ